MEINVAKTFNEPSEVAAEQGHVIVDGPDGTAATFTPKAAEETGHRLEAGAAQAEEQPQDATTA